MISKHTFLFFISSHWTIFSEGFSSILVPPLTHDRLPLYYGHGIDGQNSLRNERKRSVLSASFIKAEEEKELVTTTLFDFTGKENENVKTIESFQRIDDAIMGGISTSTLRSVTGKPYASFSGVCREDGGGFCGFRTLPFVEPINVTNADGIFFDCRLVSDNEPERRVWKSTIRTDTSRGEIVYQSQFEIPADEDGISTWKRIKVPFDSYQQVRGPRLIMDGPKLDTSGGIYQVGMTMSKFLMRENTTTLENFRPGFFDLQLERIGIFFNDDNVNQISQDKQTSVLQVETLTEKEAARKRPLILRLLFPVLKFFFSENRSRRKSGMKILMEKRGLSRYNAIKLLVKNRAQASGMLPAIFRAFSIISLDLFRTIMIKAPQLILVYPLVTISRMINFIQRKVFKKEIQQLPSME